MIDFSSRFWQTFIPVAKFVLTIGLSLFVTVSLMNYTAGFFHSPANLLFHFDAQDSARKAIEQIRQDIQRAGFNECGGTTRMIKNTKESQLLMKGIVVGDRCLHTAYLMPLLPASAQLRISPTHNTLIIYNAPDLKLQNLQNMTLFVGNCILMDQVKLPDIPFDGHSIRLTGSISNLLINAETGNLLDNVRLYELRESVIRYSPHTTYDQNTIGDGVPALYWNGKPLATGLAEDGFSMTESAEGFYSVVLNFDDDLYKRRYGEALYRFGDAGLFTFRVTPRNTRKEMER